MNSLALDSAAEELAFPVVEDLFGDGTLGLMPLDSAAAAVESLHNQSALAEAGASQEVHCPACGLGSEDLLPTRAVFIIFMF